MTNSTEHQDRTPAYESRQNIGSGQSSFPGVEWQSSHRIANLVLQGARPFLNKAAIIAGKTTLTYRQAMARLRDLSLWASENSPPQGNVVICMRNGVDAALLPLALWSTGLVSVPVNWRMSALELANVIIASDAAIVIHDEHCGDIVRQAFDHIATAAGAQAIPSVCLDQDAWPSPQSARSLAVDATSNQDDLASISFTSGTLGTPKGVMMSHGNWDFVYRNILSVRDFTSDDVVALVGPLSHSAGTYIVPLLLSGATIVLPADTDPVALADDVRRHRITVLQCVPTLLTRLTASQTFCETTKGMLRRIIYGAESIPYATLEAAMSAFGPILTQNYGLTEAMMTCAHLPASEHFVDGTGPGRTLRHGVVGRPYPLVEITLRDDDGALVGDGETGEITIRSPHVMLGYWRDPELTAKTLKNGWLWTGDLARWTDDGYLELIGRSKDMIICGGMNIYPAEVQAFLSRMPGVAECAVFGRASAAWGEELVAAVIPALGGGPGNDALRRAARDLLGIKTPKQWIFLEDLPRTANGKVDFSALKRFAGASQGSTA